MKTPIQELLAYTADLLHTFDSEERVAMAVLDYLKSNKDAMLEKDKEVIKNAYMAGESDATHKMDSSLNYYNETFNTNK